MMKQRNHAEYVKQMAQNTVPLQDRLYQRVLYEHKLEIDKTLPKRIKFTGGTLEKMTIEAATKEKEKQLQMDKKKIIQKDKEGSNLLISNVDDDSDTPNTNRIHSPNTSTGNTRKSRFGKKGGMGTGTLICASDGDNNSVSSGDSPK